MTVVCVLLGALVAVAHGQAYVSYYGQDLHHATLSKESNTPQEAEVYQQNHENNDSLSELLLKHYGFVGDEQPAATPPKGDLQHHIQKREIGYQQHIPIIGKDGVPLDTPEVQRAKQQHFIAHVVAKAQQHYPHYENDADGAYVPSVIPKHPHEYIPIIGKSGVPIDTPEVQFARKQHFAAIEAVKARQYHNFVVAPKESIEESYVEHPEREIAYEQHIDVGGGRQELDYGYY